MLQILAMRFLALLAFASVAIAIPRPFPSFHDDSAQELMMGEILPSSWPGFDLNLNEPRLVQLEGQGEPVIMTELEKVCGRIVSLL